MNTKKFKQLCDEGELLLRGSDPLEVQSDFEYWISNVSDWLLEVAPEQGFSAEWVSLGRSPLVRGDCYYNDSKTWNVFYDIVQQRLVWLSKIHDRINKHKNSPLEDDLWSLVHPEIVSVAKSRFDTEHYADAVEACFKYINSYIKNQTREFLAKELDGSSLMTRVFSPNNPIIQLADLGTESGKNIQKGYMQIFSGGMTGIRNPNAHANITISREQAIHQIFLASLLMWQLNSAKIIAD